MTAPYRSWLVGGLPGISKIPLTDPRADQIRTIVQRLPQTLRRATEALGRLRRSADRATAALGVLRDTLNEKDL